MRVDINRKLDTTQIHEFIDLYRISTGHDPHYLVMNISTINELAMDAGLIHINNDDRYAAIFGIPIATCNILEYGYIDII